jgi:hypothetical protein
MKIAGLPYVYLIEDYFVKNISLKASDYRDKSTMKFDGDSAKSLTVHHNQSTIHYLRDDKGQWSAPGRVKAQEEASNLVSLLSNTSISDFASRTASTGLSNPPFTVEVGLKDGTTRK